MEAQPNHHFLDDFTYYKSILRMQDDFPHLRCLSKYIETTENLRINGSFTSPNSNSILIAEIGAGDNGTCTRVDCYGPKEINYEAEFPDNNVFGRFIVVEDISPAAIEALGSWFKLDPHVFYFHLGFDKITSQSSEPSTEKAPPNCWYIPGNVFENFISVPMPCDLETTGPARALNLDHSAQYTTTCGGGQSFRPLAEIDIRDRDRPGSCNLLRAFNRISLIFPESKIPTVIVLGYPTWRSSSGDVGSAQHSMITSFAHTMNHRMLGNDFTAKLNISRKGDWTLGQGDRVEPIFHALIYGFNPDCIKWRGQPKQQHSGFLRQQAMLWLYSVMNKHYYSAAQTETRVWEEIKRILNNLGTDYELIGNKLQRTKKQIRDSIDLSVEYLETSKIWIDEYLKEPNAYHKQFLECLQRAVDAIIRHQRARLGEIQQSINDYQQEVELFRMIGKMRDTDTPPGSPKIPQIRNTSTGGIAR